VSLIRTCQELAVDSHDVSERSSVDGVEIISTSEVSGMSWTWNPARVLLGNRCDE
jgi:hypothetical protein